MVGEAVTEVHLVVCNVVTGIDMVAAMDCTVDNAAGFVYHMSTVFSAIVSHEFTVDAASDSEVYVAFVLEYAGFHTEEVVALALFEIRVAALEQKLAGLEIVVGVELVRNRYRHQVYRQNILLDRATAVERHHLDKAFLSHVVGVLGTAFALGNPYRFVQFAD